MIALLKKASEVGALEDSGIAPDRLEEVLALCDTPYEEGIDIRQYAQGLDLCNPIKWDAEQARMGHRGIYIPDSDTLVKEHGTWEAFWNKMGYETYDYDCADIIELTVNEKPSGILQRDTFDRNFPESCSSSYVIRLFGSFPAYFSAVENTRRSTAMADSKRTSTFPDKANYIN
ncbi:hypothetical protein ACFL0V_03240 [Nanoarchaeota archaeon]